MRLSFSSRAVSIRIGTASRRECAGQIEPVLARHHHIENQEIEIEPFELGPRFARRFGGGDPIAFAQEKAREQRADAAIVVDNKQMWGVIGGIRGGNAPCVS